jgi:transposase InsO family protein
VPSRPLWRVERKIRRAPKKATITRFRLGWSPPRDGGSTSAGGASGESSFKLTHYLVDRIQLRYLRRLSPSRDRTQTLRTWLIYYNRWRSHGSLAGKPPLSRIDTPMNNVSGNYS